MPRPRSFEYGSVVRAVRDLFWERGYEATTISEIEDRTGLNRSSLYATFGSKRVLLGLALRCYVDESVASLLANLRQDSAGLAETIAFFRYIAAFLRTEPDIAGCLMVNTVTELATRDAEVAASAAEYRDGLHSAFTGALQRAADRGEVAAEATARRVDLLVAMMLGLAVAERIDAEHAATLAETIAVEITSWRTQV